MFYLRIVKKLKKLYNDNKEFMIIVKELSLDLYKLYNEIDNILKVFIVWNNFFNIYVCIKDNCYQKENIIQLVNEQTFNWLVSYQEIYGSTHITPYEHVFGDHLGEMIQYFGDVLFV